MGGNIENIQVFWPYRLRSPVSWRRYILGSSTMRSTGARSTQSSPGRLFTGLWRVVGSVHPRRRNTLVPINRTPLKIFSLIPHCWERQYYWDRLKADQDLILMT